MVGREGVVEVAHFMLRLAQIEGGFGVSRPDFEGAPEFRPGTAMIALFELGDPKRESGLDEFGIDLDCPFECRRRFIDPISTHKRLSQHEMRFDEFGPNRNCALERIERIVAAGSI